MLFKLYKASDWIEKEVTLNTLEELIAFMDKQEDSNSDTCGVIVERHDGNLRLIIYDNYLE